MTASTTVDGISVTRDGAVATVWLDRPDRGNAFISAMQVELHRQLAELDADPTIRVIVVTGRGKLFSAGADMEPGGSNFAFDAEQHDRSRAELADRVRPWRLRTPIIGALNGSAVGIGLTFALQWDIRVVSESAKYGFVFPRRGLIPEQNSLWLLPRLVGLATAIELMLTGRLFNGVEAVRLGVATHAVETTEVLGKAYEIAEEIVATTSPLAVGLTKQLLYENLEECDREASFYREWEAFRWIGRSEDAAEGVASFIEKRAPDFPGDQQEKLPTVGRSWRATDE